jgi:large subunit ribosomal protein L35
MPKIKVRGAVKKRFKLTASGKIKRARAFASHLLTKKSSKRKRHLRARAVVSGVDQGKVKELLRV